MSRPLRLQFAGAVYHVTSRGDRQQLIYLDDTDRLAWLEMLASTCARFNFTVHSFCQMTNHYHVVIETGDANLSRGMRQLNALYAQYFNRRHQRVGHVFQGRYHAIMIQKEAHLREVARYVMLNPIRARMVATVEEWRWSSYHLMTQAAEPPCWLQTDWMLGLFGTHRQEAIEAFRLFVAEGVDAGNPIKNARHQLLLGDEAFVARHRDAHAGVLLSEVTKEHRQALALSLAEYEVKFRDRDQAIAAAYASTAYTMAQIAAHFKISYRTVSRIVRKMDAATAVAVCDWQN